MNFDFDDTQYLLRDMARDLFANESPPSRIRQLWDGKPFDRGVWKTMADAGLCGLTVPENYGGSGGSELDLALVYEEAGRAGLPDPLLETTGIAAPLIAEVGSDELHERWLPAIAKGEVIIAVQPPGRPYVTWAQEADAVIAERGGAPYLAAKDAFTVEPVAPLDPARPIATVTVDTAKAARLETRPWANAAYRGAFGTGALLVGVAQAELERSVAYVKDREQFGRPVGSFQAIKHKLATMHQMIETARPATWYAAYAIAHDHRDAFEAASIAKIAAQRAEEFCNVEALQCHGGIGFTWEDDLHLWLKRGISLRTSWGDARAHKRRLVGSVLDD